MSSGAGAAHFALSQRAAKRSRRLVSRPPATAQNTGRLGGEVFCGELCPHVDHPHLLRRALVQMRLFLQSRARRIRYCGNRCGAAQRRPKMIATIQILVLLLIAIAAVAIVAVRINIPSSILLVITGVALALLPGLPAVRIAPDVVLLLVLPPVIYSSAVAMSWREFRFNLRPITLLAVGCVVFTTVAVAAASHWLLGLSWQVGFVLGAIVSPPDAVAPLSIARRMCLPRRITVILEGEGLANDATALILYRFAVAAAVGGVFSI